MVSEHGDHSELSPEVSWVREHHSPLASRIQSQNGPSATLGVGILWRRLRTRWFLFIQEREWSLETKRVEDLDLIEPQSTRVYPICSGQPTSPRLSSILR